ncbi:acyl-activating enzyme 19 [Dorcoceras hygrometricum]|uniref:Acyl-activating enzyme 19 n=1 Tax=Dorcoceras hygrometricum TaxID=472368 RepID=A0A2Z7CQP6_9LAMI|nr:acyl-activating enzyme 19 [Dorcoceras hygrometricum]
MVSSSGKQSPGYAVQLSILLEKLVKADLGESVDLSPMKVLKNKSVLTYLKKNQAAPQDGEVRKISKDKEKAAAELKKEKSDRQTSWASLKRKAITAQSTSESKALLIQPKIKKKQRTKRPKLVKLITAEVEKVVSKDLPLQVQPTNEPTGQQPTSYGTGMVFSRWI